MRMPCWKLCEIVEDPAVMPYHRDSYKWKAKNLKRPHGHCLTCPTRRHFYNVGDARRKFVKMPPNRRFIMALPINTTMIPVNHRFYFLLVNENCRFLWLKRLLLRPLLSIAEVIANW